METALQSTREPTAGTREELVARAKALVPVLRERAPVAEELRRLPDDTVQDLVDAGLCRVLQPARIGGSELDFTAMIDVCSVIGSACGSTGWVLAQMIIHQFMVATWPKEAQEDVWGGSPDSLVCGVLIFPAGRANKVDGGYRLSGRWPFASGIDASHWCIFGALVDSEETGSSPEFMTFLVPRREYEILDTWYAAGLRGTGSHDVKVEDVFVPNHLTLAVDDTKGGDTPGGEVNPTALYKLPQYSMFSYVNGGAALGIAQGTLETYVEETRSRIAKYSGKRIVDFSTIQVKIAEAASSINAARLIMHANCEEAMRIAEAGGVPTMEQKVKYRRDGAFASTLCTRAVDVLFTASGGGGLYDDNPMSRAFRDIHAVSAHITLNWDVNASTYGRVALAMSPDNPTL